MNDTHDEPLEKGATYKISDSESTNLFDCFATDDPNGTMFIRQHDGMVHLGREFIEYRNGKPCYAVERVDSANTKASCSGPESAATNEEKL